MITLPLKNRTKLPSKSGVYYFLDQSRAVLYVGRAVNLGNRVNSYFGNFLDPKIEQMVRKAQWIGYQETQTLLEALLLEANEIRRIRPKYNSVGKDDKAFAQIGVTDEDFPQLVLIRPNQRSKTPLAKTFGPYTSAKHARIALKIINNIFKLKCKGKPFSDRQCFYYQIGQCQGICIGRISTKDYRRSIKAAVMLLEGKRVKIIKSLKKQMAEAARDERFEHAAIIRDQIFGLGHINDTALAVGERFDFWQHELPERVEVYDISNQGAHFAVGSMVVISRGRPDSGEYRRFKIKTVQQQNDPAMIKEVVLRRLSHPEWRLPNLIIVDGGKTQLVAALTALEQSKHSIPTIAVAKGANRKGLAMHLSHQARNWLKSKSLSTHALEALLRLGRDEAHRFAIDYHRKIKNRDWMR